MYNLLKTQIYGLVLGSIFKLKKAIFTKFVDETGINASCNLFEDLKQSQKMRKCNKMKCYKKQIVVIEHFSDVKRSRKSFFCNYPIAKWSSDMGTITILVFQASTVVVIGSYEKRTASD